MNVPALIAEARAARSSAHAPYSGFAVGAALLTTSGSVYRGVNVENVSSGLTVCAERAAVFAAVTAGERTFRALAVATDATLPTPPCGACRQVLHEFAPDLTLHLAGGDGAPVSYSLAELLPHPFTTRNLENGR